VPLDSADWTFSPPPKYALLCNPSDSDVSLPSRSCVTWVTHGFMRPRSHQGTTGTAKEFGWRRYIHTVLTTNTAHTTAIGSFLYAFPSPVSLRVPRYCCDASNSGPRMVPEEPSGNVQLIEPVGVTGPVAAQRSCSERKHYATLRARAAQRAAFPNRQQTVGHYTGRRAHRIHSLDGQV
jgi:hypothetical protein